MKQVLSFLVVLVVLFSATSCDSQNQDKKSGNEVKQYSTKCVKSFIKKVYKQKDSGRDLCFAYTLPGGGHITLYDVATQLGVKWDPDEVSIQEEIDTVCDDKGIFKYAVVYAKYQGKQVKFFVGFDKGLLQHDDYVSGSTTYYGSEGSTVILDSEGFLPNKIAEEGKKQHIKFSFGTHNDMINYMLAKGVQNYRERANSFLLLASNGDLNYRDSEKRGSKIGDNVLRDSIRNAKLIGFEYSQDLKSVLSTINKDGIIELYAQPCHLIYTKSVGAYVKKYVFDSEGVVDWNSCWKYLFRSSDWVHFTLACNIDEKTDIELFDMATERMKEHMRFEDNRRLINELEQRNQY